MRKYEVFVSYASVDVSRVFKIVEALENLGYTCWIAPRDIVPGTPYARAIMTGIEMCEYFIVVLTENSIISDNVLNEIENAHSLHKRIIPVFLNDLKLPNELNFYLRRLHWITLDETSIGNVSSVFGLPPKTNVDHYEAHNSVDTQPEPISDKTKENFTANEKRTDSQDKVIQRHSFVTGIKQIWNSNKRNIVQIIVVVAVLSTLSILWKKCASPKTDANIEILEKQDDKKSTNTFSGDTLVDLGLTVLWAPKNLGAQSPMNRGYFFEWSVLSPAVLDTNYSQILRTFSDISGDSKYDAATSDSQYGEKLRMPTIEEFKELKNECSWEWADIKIDSIKSVYGYIVTGKNGNTIFLPACGRRIGDKYLENNPEKKISGNYWSSTAKSNWNAKLLYFTDHEITVAHLEKYYGLSIRPVSDRPTK